MQTSLHRFNSEGKYPPNLTPIKAKTYTGRYAMHRYWARKPYNVIAKYIESFTNKGDIILDPFCGSGVTAIEALILRRKAIAVDLNPMATFITRNTAMPVGISEFVKAFRELERNVKDRINSLYETECPTCQSKAVILNTIWKDTVPMKIKFRCQKCRTDGKKQVTPQDLAKLNEIDDMEIPYWYPQDELMENSRINVYRGMRVCDLFTKRNLTALSILWNEIETLRYDAPVKDLMKFVFTAAVSQASKMVFVIRRRGRLRGIIKGRGKRKIVENTEEVGSRVIGYWIPSERFEINAWNCFENRFKKILIGKKQTNELIGSYYREGESFEDLEKKDKTILILTRSATDLSCLPKESVDYVFTDPPYGDQIPYLELDAMWASWLKFKMNYEDEIVISDSPVRNKRFEQYKEGLAKAFGQIYDVLKPGKFMSVAFYNYDLRIWHALFSACLSAGFEKINILPITASHPSIVQLYRPGGSKGALIITFRKTPEKKLPLKNMECQVDVEEVIINIANELISEKGDVATYEIYDRVIEALIDKNALDKEKDVLKLLRDRFEFIQGKWKLRNSTATV